MNTVLNKIANINKYHFTSNLITDGVYIIDDNDDDIEYYINNMYRGLDEYNLFGYSNSMSSFYHNTNVYSNKIVLYLTNGFNIKICCLITRAFMDDFLYFLYGKSSTFKKIIDNAWENYQYLSLYKEEGYQDQELLGYIDEDEVLLKIVSSNRLFTSSVKKYFKEYNTHYNVHLIKDI